MKKALFVGFLILAAGFCVSFANQKEESVTMIQHTVTPGQSYWSIAEKYYDQQSEKDMREFVAQIKQANNTYDSRLTTGQVIVIPIKGVK